MNPQDEIASIGAELRAMFRCSSCGEPISPPPSPPFNTVPTFGQAVDADLALTRFYGVAYRGLTSTDRRKIATEIAERMSDSGESADDAVQHQNYREKIGTLVARTLTARGTRT